MRIKLLSYNIHKGFDWKNQKYNLQEMKSLIVESGADIVLLQEVVGKNEQYIKKGLIDTQFEFLADGIWPHYSYGRNAVYDHGHHGNLILSKYPIKSFENVDLSTNVLEKRGMLICKIEAPEMSFYAACLHLNLLHAGRKLQYKSIERHLHLKNKNEPNDIPIIVGGDFNDWNFKSAEYFEDKLGMQEVHKTKHGDYAKTFPSGFPFLCLDRVYVKNSKVLDSRIVFHPKTNFLSDHLPLFSEIELCEK